MGIQELQTFLESAGLEGGSVSVDLLKIARNVTNRQQPHNSNRKVRPIGNKLKLIIDAENCLDRLYGGFFSDWACGGQWNRMFHFISLLTQTVERGNIELAVVFNGTMESNRLSEWVEQQATIRQKVGMVLKHVNTKATPPPKVWWTAPICLRTSLRMALRHLGITVISTMDDHHQEVIAYCREYGFHGLMADDAEYVAFDPPRYFSSVHIKLTYKGSLETKEFMVSECLKALGVSREQMCVVASLLGNFLLKENELQDVYRKIQLALDLKDTKLTGETAVKAISEYVRSLPSPSKMDDLIVGVFGSLTDKRADVFKQSVLYFLHGTADGFLKYMHLKGNKKDVRKKPPQNNNVDSNIGLKPEESDMETIFASETTEQEQESLQNYRIATANAIITNTIEGLTDLESTTTKLNSLTFEETRTEGPQLNGHTTNGSTNQGGPETKTKDCPKVNLLVRSSSTNNNTTSISESPKTVPTPDKPSSASNVVAATVSLDVLRTCALRHQKGLMCPRLLHLLSTQELRLPCVMEDEGNREFPAVHDVYLPMRRKIYAVLFNLHHHRYVYAKEREASDQAATASAAAAAASIATTSSTSPKDSPPGDNTTSPQTSSNTTTSTTLTSPPDIIVREYTYTRSNPYQTAAEVRAEPLPWAVPTLHRLWFGPGLDDKRRRMRALLSCLHSDTPLILNTAYVPQHMLVMACVLRYIMSLERPILRRNELDVFLCQAFNPDLMNIQYLQELTLNIVTSRGVQLAALFMQGVEMALLANDACGAPLPWLMCCPWLYFDGKLFHHTLTRSTHAKSLLDLCENHIDRVVKVERIRKAILEGLDVKFYKFGNLTPYPGLIRQAPSMHMSAGNSGNNLSNNLMSSLGNSRSAGVTHNNHNHNHHHHHQQGGAGGNPHHNQQQQQHNMRRTVNGRGGQLQVAGVVVGSWGANYRFQGSRGGAQGGGGGGQQQQLSYRGGGGGGGSGRDQQHNGNSSYMNHHHHQQQQQYHQVPRGGRPRKQGPPTFTVNKVKVNTFNNKKKTTPAKAKPQHRARGKNETTTTANSIGEVPIDVGTKSTEQGQGDGPSLETKCN